MAEAWVEAVGLTAGVLTTLAFLPQVLKTWRTRAVRDLSLPMYLSLTVGVFLWLVYGLLQDSPSIILANGVTFILALSILIMKIRYHR
ncbi:MAG: SemiSWEET transporter [Desulfovibrio aminophilus]|jgi:MtN3 and saliva related transmembrane protein|uniref:SemiSWEET transporter n=1 Tax=Desulfovibrio aminophilus TaxID=81425 RepID=UPI000486C5EA|nr:SemiSWEET transporter [Desulfovibrio aminophilus]MDY0307342.1 SemiSWEET transporter [Desulfovibrionaceae bacterium]